MERKFEFEGSTYRITMIRGLGDNCTGCAFNNDGKPTQDTCDTVNAKARESIGRDCFFKHIYKKVN